MEVTAEPRQADLALVGDRLAAFNEGEVGPAAKVPLAVFVRSEDGAVVAGISGYTAWGWLYMQWLWVDESLRGRNVAGEMLAEAEEEAAARGCRGVWVDTFNPHALSAYQRQGYEVFGELPDFPDGRTRTFLKKLL